MSIGINRENITIVLHRPKYQGNIGSAARAALNMGFHNIIVTRREEPDMEEIRRMATHLAGGNVDRIRFFDGPARRPLRISSTLSARLPGSARPARPRPGPATWLAI